MASERVEAILATIAGEREAQCQEWGEQRHTDVGWLSILAEEFGEAAKEINEWSTPGEQHGRPDAMPANLLLYNEVIQIAAVAAAWAECIVHGAADAP